MPPANTRKRGGIPGRPPILPTELLHLLVKRGLTNKQISEELVELGERPASSAALTAWRKRHNYKVRSSTEERLRLIPWKVAVEHSHNRIYVCLSLIARERSGGDMDDRDHSRMDKFKRELAELQAVVHYDRENGWKIVPPRPGIDVDYIRDPRLDDDGQVIEDFDPAA